MAAVYSDPTYVLTTPASTLLSDARPTRPSSAALASLNRLLDELLHLIVHAALHSAPIATAPNGGAQPAADAPVPLEEEEVLTTERFKSALARILGPTSLAKECILEAELAIRELVRRASPSLRTDGALKKTSGRGIWGSPVLPETASLPGAAAGEAKDLLRGKVTEQAVEVFRCLRAWVMQISGVGAAAPLSGAPPSLTDHLVALSPPRPPPSSARSPHISFILALYVERVLTHLTTHILHLVASSASSRPSPGSEVTATVTDLEAALVQDQLVWSWVQGMRVWATIEQDGRNERARSRNGGMGRRRSANSSNAASPNSSSAGGIPLPDVGTLERRSSLASSTAVASTSDTRRASSSSTIVGSPNGAKQRAGLGIGIRANGKTSASVEDSFDQLLSSGKTIKLSSTPDRLRFEQQNKRTSGSQSMSALSSSTGSTGSASRHLQARAPQFSGVLSEGDEADQPDSGHERPPGPRKDSLIDLLNSPPPWSGGDPSPSRRQGVVPKRPVPQDDPLHPVSVAMRVQGSQNSVSTVDTAASDVVDGYDGKSSPGARIRALKAKDEKRDLASERQVNHDLIAFFAAEPPSLPRPTNAADPRTSLEDSSSKDKSVASKKSRGGLRGLVSRVTGGSGGGGKKDDLAGPVSPTSPPPNSPPPPPPRSQVESPPYPTPRTHSIDSGEGSAARSAQTAPRAANVGDSVTRASTYAPPPGLGSPSPREPARRSMSVPKVDQPPKPSSSSPAMASTHQRGDRSHRILQNGGSSAEASASEDGHTSRVAPPIPLVDAVPVVTPPRRSSSLRRSRREREASAASASTVSTTRARPVETAAPPVTVEPVAPTAPLGPASLSAKAAVSATAVTAALGTGMADAAAHERRLDSDEQTSALPPSSLTPVVEPAPAPTTPSAPLSPARPWSSPARPSSSSGLSGKTVVSHLRELRSAMLAYAHSKEDCVELVEAMLRDEARRVEKLAQREREETLAKEKDGEVDRARYAATTSVTGTSMVDDARGRGDGQAVDGDGPTSAVQDDETHQARVAEFFLTCDGELSAVEDE